MAIQNLMKSFQKSSRIAAKHMNARGVNVAEHPVFARAEAGSVGSLYIYKQIGDSWFEEGVTAESVRQALEGLKGVKTLNVFINSSGGDVFEGKAIYTQLKRFSSQGANIVVHIDGIAASAASFIAMAGDTVKTSPAATWMVHNAAMFAFGNADDMREGADLLEMMDGDIAGIYAAKTGRKPEDLRALMAAETWMTAEEAKKEGFTDEVVDFSKEDDDEEEETVNRAPAAQRMAAMIAAQGRAREENSDRLRQLKLQRVGNAHGLVAPAASSGVDTSTSARASAGNKRAAPTSRG